MLNRWSILCLVRLPVKIEPELKTLTEVKGDIRITDELFCQNLTKLITIHKLLDKSPVIKGLQCRQFRLKLLINYPQR